MGYRILHLHVDKSQIDQVQEILKDPAICDHWQVEQAEDYVSHEMLVRTADTQKLMDKIQTFLGKEEIKDVIGVDNKNDHVRLVVQPVSAVWPIPEDRTEPNKKTFAGLSREELYNEIDKGSTIDLQFIALVILSAVVAAIGLLEDNVAVIIGAMVIAPLLGPNLALAFGASLGDLKMIRESIVTNVLGLSMAIAFGAILGMAWPYELNSFELLSRTKIGYDGIIVALASGAAGVLSLTAGVSSVLVGVMVAVALLPPAVALGIMLGSENFGLAMGAGTLLAVNVVCVNLSAKIVFWLKGIGPREWQDKQKARTSMGISVAVWVATLAALTFLIRLGF